MVLKFYGHPISTCTHLVDLVCKEKSIPYDFVLVNLVKGEQKTPETIKHHPFGNVPYIDDDGFILYESRAISRYLIKKYPNQGTLGLIPTDPKEEALFEQAASIEVSNFDVFANPLVHEKVYNKYKNLPTDETRVKEYLGKLEAKLDVYEVILGKQKYLAGDNLTLADLQHLPYGSLLFNAGYGDVLLKRPNVARWWGEISNRPSWKAVNKAL